MSPRWMRVLSAVLALAAAVSLLTRRRQASPPVAAGVEYPSLETRDYLAEWLPHESVR